MTDPEIASGAGSDKAHVDELIARHCPAKVTDEERTAVRAAVHCTSVEALVVSCDIRSSTFLMKEAVDPLKFADALSVFLGRARDCFTSFGGWFDKFTGDGFLAYWILGEWHDGSPPSPSTFESVSMKGLSAAFQTLRYFNGEAIDTFKANSQNFPVGVGLRFGFDFGPCHPVLVADELTIVGPPVVGAVRMSDAAQAGEALCNTHLAYKLLDSRFMDTFIELASDVRKTKEFEQEVWRVSYSPSIADLLSKGDKIPAAKKSQLGPAS